MDHLTKLANILEEEGFMFTKYNSFININPNATNYHIVIYHKRSLIYPHYDIVVNKKDHSIPDPIELYMLTYTRQENVVDKLNELGIPRISNIKKSK